MTKWKPSETYFDVEVSNDGRGGNSSRIPKPIYERLGKPKRIAFVIDNDGIGVIMSKYHKITTYVCDVRGCKYIFDSEKKVQLHQRVDHKIQSSESEVHSK